MEYRRLEAEDHGRLKDLVGAERFSAGPSVLDLHAQDRSAHPARRPEAVLWPVSAGEVAAVLAYAHGRRIPVTAWGAGSSLEGNPIPACGGIVLDCTRMDRILEVREGDFQADVEPGVLYPDLNRRLRHSGLFFPPDPGTPATVGGMIANNASGPHAVGYGPTRDYVQRLTVVLATGEVLELGTRAPKTSSGYDLLRLFVGSEGTLGLVVRATLRLAGLPAEVSAAVIAFPTVAAAARAVFEITRAGLAPAALELMDPRCVALMNREEGLGLPERPTLFAEFHGVSSGSLAEVLAMARELCAAEGCLEFRAGVGWDDRDRLWRARHVLGEMIIRTHPDCRVVSLDVAVPLAAYPELMAAVEGEARAVGAAGYTFSHAGDGNVHLVVAGLRDDPNQWRRIDEITDRLVGRALALGGTCTGEHGVGLGKRRFMEAEHGPSLEWMRRLKALFDPHGILNPGKIFP
ncbi:MAG: FAD-binding oxidoreductase [Deferrisomatales bacterium]